MINDVVTVTAPQVEHVREPLGIGQERPRLTWQITGPPGWSQARYQLRLLGADGTASEVLVRSADQVLVPWPFDSLSPRQRVDVCVRVWGNDGTRSEWGPATTIEAGLSAADWLAVPVGPSWPEDRESDARRPCLVRTEFTAGSRITRARLHATAHGVFEVEINGKRVGSDALSPGWTVYGRRLRYHTYDVTEFVGTGENAIGAWLGDGWYRGRIGFKGGRRNLYGDDIGLIAQLEISYADGTTQIVATDATWKAAPSPIVQSGLYDGERYDARLFDPTWSQPGHPPRGWVPVRVGQRDPATLVTADGPPVRQATRLKPERSFTTPTGRTVLDFGQNLVGRLRIRVSGRRGETVRIRHAEVLQEGEIYDRTLRDALSVDEYTLNGDDVEEWEPRFTIHGFRYAEVTGWPNERDLDDFTAIVYHTDMRRTGWFECSDQELNRLHENVVWSTRGNFVDIPTDCPQRDERLGWTGDIQVFAPTASFLFDCAGMLTSWLKDVAAEQLEDGTVPWYVPVVPGGSQWTPIRPGAGWGDVAVLTPWTMYERFGDLGILEQQYESAKAWVDLVDRLAGPEHLWNTGFQLGDWLDPRAPPDDPAASLTDPYLVATAYFAWSALHLAETAAVIGRTDDARTYADLASAVRDAFRAAYLTPAGAPVNDTATANALTIAFDLLDDDRHRRTAGARLADLVRQNANRITTGFLGTPVISGALTDTGHLDTAYDLLLERECPSWLYMVLSGATTIWERWDSMRPDGTVNPGGMTSFNHYALGSVADWMHRVIGGLEAVSPGYRQVRVRPRPGGGIRSCRVRHVSPYGDIAVAWTEDGEGLDLQVEVPVGVSASVEFPDRPVVVVSSGQHRFRGALPESAAEHRTSDLDDPTGRRHR